MGFWLFLKNDAPKCARNRGNLVGQRFGKLLVVSHGKRIGKVLFYNCLCDCGNMHEVRRYNLGRSTNSCGCSKRCNIAPIIAMNGPPKIQAAINKLFRRYRDDAVRYGHREFDLSLAQLTEITSSDCHYCGESPSRSIHSEKLGPRYIFNGIDRVNNDVGYLIGNVVPCCTQCNYAKGRRTVVEFLDWAERVANHTRKKNEAFSNCA